MFNDPHSTLFKPQPFFILLALETPYHVSICLWPFVHEQPAYEELCSSNLLSCLIFNRLEVNNLSWTPLTWSPVPFRRSLLLFSPLLPSNLLCVFNLLTKDDTPLPFPDLVIDSIFLASFIYTTWTSTSSVDLRAELEACLLLLLFSLSHRWHLILSCMDRELDISNGMKVESREEAKHRNIS